MDKTLRGILDPICGNTAFALTMFFVVAFVFIWTAHFEPSWDGSLIVLGLGVGTTVIEFGREQAR